VLAACAAAYVVVRRRRLSRGHARAFKPAHEIAYERLRRLVGDNPVERGRIKEFYERVSNILRHYIEDRFSVRAPEQTTEEFLCELQYTDALGDSDKRHVGRFLEHCDLVKFARFSPETAQIQEAFNIVRDFIDRTKSDEKKVDVTDKTVEPETTAVGS
jgi:hypothetical protein